MFFSCVVKVRALSFMENQSASATTALATNRSPPRRNVSLRSELALSIIENQSTSATTALPIWCPCSGTCTNL